MSRRTLSHFLNRDSDKKKKCPCKHFFGLFFYVAGAGKKLCRLSEVPIFFFPIFPMLTHGVLGVVPRLRRSLPRRTKRGSKTITARKIRPRPSGVRVSAFSIHIFRPLVVCVSAFSIHERDRVLPADKKKRSRGKIRRERFMKPKRKRLKRRAVRRERLREPALLPQRERRLLSPFWLWEPLFSELFYNPRRSRRSVR